MAKQVLDRRAKAAVGAAAFLLIAAPVLAVTRYVGTQMHVSNIADAQGLDDRLVSFGNGTTALLPHGSVAQRLTDWVKLGKQDESVLQIGDGMFVPNSTEFTPSGWQRLSAFADLMKAHSNLKAEVIVGTRRQDPDVERLEQLRAKRLHDEAEGLGVAPERITFSTQRIADLMSNHRADRVRNGSQIHVHVSKS